MRARNLALSVTLATLGAVVSSGIPTGAASAESNTRDVEATSYAIPEDFRPESDGPYESSLAFDVAVGSLQQALRAALPEVFAGVYRDTTTARRVQVLVAGDADAARRQVEALFVRPDLVDIQVVSSTLSAIEDAQRKITAEWDAIVAAGLDLSRSSVDVVANRLRVYVVNYKPEHGDWLQERYGSAVEVLQGEPIYTAACTGRYTCTEMRGGIEVGTSNASCTAAFSAVRGSTLGMITAGHCGNINEAFFHGVIPMGSMIRRQYSGEVDGKCQAG